MLRRTVLKANKGPQNPGPTLQGWGRTAQKRRLEYETVENKYGAREFNKNWDVVGLQTRSTDMLQCRTYFNFPQRMIGFAFNWSCQNIVTMVPGAIFLLGYHEWVTEVDHHTKRAAWW